MRVRALAAAAVVVFGCGRGPAREDREAAGPAPDEAHVVFTRADLVVDRLGEPIPLPVTASSRPSPATLSSDDPAVVSLDHAGRLLAHSAGATTLRSRAGQGGALAVTVVAPSGLRADPAHLLLAPGESAAVVLRDEQGRALPEGAGVWSTSAPDAVVVSRGKAHAFGKLGDFELTARSGSASVKVPVSVRTEAPRLEIQPAQARVKRGEVVLFQAMSARRPVVADWRAAEPRLLSSVGRGLFQGGEPGRTRACARAGGRQVCADVEVEP